MGHAPLHQAAALCGFLRKFNLVSTLGCVCFTLKTQSVEIASLGISLFKDRSR